MYKSPQIKEMFAGQRETVRHLKKIIFGSDPNSRKKYIKDFTEEFRTFQEISSLDDLIVSCYKADLIYLGDYHALKDCQLFEAKLIRKIAERSSRTVLGMEMVYSRNQGILDRWMEGAISEEEFLKRIRYDSEWGYDWEGFREIFCMARKCGIRVYGLDSGPRGGFQYIRKRDSFAAEKIVNLFQTFPDTKVIVIFGESHLARNHLPRKVKEKLKKANLEKREVVVVQNVDWLYWERIDRGLDWAEVIKVSDGRFCVFNSSLIAKYEAYRQTLEKWKYQEDSEEVDLTPTIHNMIDAILKFLEIDKYTYLYRKEDGYREYLIDVFPEVYSYSDQAIIRGLLLEKNYSDEEIEIIEEHISKKGSCYVSGLNAIVIGKLHVNHAGEEAAHFVNKALKQEIGSFQSRRDDLLQFDIFYAAIMGEALAFFGSKLIDPSRNHFFETQFYQYYRKGKEEIEKNTGYTYEEFNEIIRFILLHKRFEKEYQKYDQIPKELLDGIKTQKEKFTILTHELGYFLGQQMYDAYQNDLMGKEEIKSLFMMKFDRSGSALETYLSIIERVTLS
ncbi:MAG: ChaN family lipoprotein [Acidobacteriota bacterium]